METFAETLKKAIYLGVGLASYAGEQVEEFQDKAKELADDLIRRGEDTAGEATKFLDAWMPQPPGSSSANQGGDKPQKIEILSIEDVESDSNS